VCQRIIVADGNTSNTRKHLMDNHPDEWKRACNEDEDDELAAGDSESTTSAGGATPRHEDEDISYDPNEKKLRKWKRKKLTLNSQRMYGRTSEKKRKLNESLARMLAEDFQPYALVERRGFKRHLSMLNPRYQMPSRNTLANTLVPNLYEKIEAKLITRLTGARYT
jgi:hypothetical protein